jgi:hypothetical protein
MTLRSEKNQKYEKLINRNHCCPTKTTFKFYLMVLLKFMDPIGVKPL